MPEYSVTSKPGPVAPSGPLQDATGSADLVSLRDVTKVYANGTVALQGLDIGLSSGEFVTLVGPSGCGKSTVLRIIAGLGDITSGAVQVEGQKPQQARKSGRALSFVFQDPTLLPWKTVQGNVELPLKLEGMRRSARERIAREKIQLTRLTGFEDAYPRELSGGMRMRVSIARALVSDPKLLLMDEPFGALDEMTRHHMNTQLLEVWEAAQCTALFVTHNVFEAIYLSQRVLVMSDRPGCVIAEVPVEAPYPRKPEFRTSREFSDTASLILAQLREAQVDID